MHLYERKKSFIKIPTLILYLKLQKSIFGFWILTWRVMRGWVGLELSIIFTQTVGRFNMWVTPYTGIIILSKLKYFISKKDKETFRAWNKRYRLKSLNQIGLYKTLLKRWIFDDSDETEITLPLLNCLNVLEYIWWLLNSEL